MDIAVWLRDLGLERYEPIFRDSEIDWEVLPELTEGDLEKIGLPLGPRKKLVKAIAALGADQLASGDASAGAAPRGAERRQLTVMFVDLVGSTALAQQFDPEDVREVIRTYQNTVAGEITRFEGHVAKYMGDGVLAYFGWPRAHEDEAERAVRAGLALNEAVGRLRAPSGEPLAARVGIATGLVVVGDLVGDDEARERAVVGETPNLAARLQVLASAGQVVIAEATRRLLGTGFDLRDLGRHELKGLAVPVRAFAVTGERALASRFEARSGLTLLPIVGRDQELALLLERWAQAQIGEGQGVLLVGEAGIGKSRIGRALLDALAGQPHTRIRYQCSPYHTDSALWPVTQQLRRAAGIAAGDSADTKLDRLEALLGRAGDAARAAPLIANLIGLDGTARYGKLDMTPQVQRARTLQSLVDQLLGLGARQPVLVVLEDAHWIDPTTLELIEQFLERIAAARVLILLTSRPDGQPAMAPHPHITRLTLNRLGRRAVEAIVARLCGKASLPTDVTETIIMRTDGVPLFVEELTKAIVETGEATVPASLHDSLVARLDRLREVKEIAQIAACIGREFSHGLLAAVAARPEPDLESALERLATAELIFRRGSPPEATYTFKHALVQDAAYQSLLKIDRQQYHQRIAQVLEEEQPRTAESEPEILAQHYSEASLADKAIHYWHRAGQLAAQRSANVEAVTHFERGLELLSQLPETPERHGRELEIQMALGPVLVAARGFADPSVGRAYARAWELCQRLEDKVRLPVVLRGRQVFHRLRGELGKARDFAAQLLALAERQQDPALLVGSCHALGQDLFQMGDLMAARRIVEQGIAVFDPEQHRLRNWPGGQPGEQCYLYDAFVLWMLGYPDQGLRRGEEALILANELSNPANLINTLAFVALVHVFRRELTAARQRAKATMAMSAEQRNPFFLAWGTILHGWAQTAQDQGEDGTAEIDQGIATYRATSSQTWLPYFLGLQAETYLRAKRPDDGLASVAEALALGDKTEERCWQAELQRIKGELLLAVSSNNHAEAGRCFFQSLDIARSQQAKSLELRAAASLSRLWCDRGKHKEARDLLAPIYAWFTEGFETADVTDAKALLDELG